jgi:surfactin synthase thioesterase subunit
MPTKYFENKSSSVARMFCLPYAGGNAEFYLLWRNFVPSWIDLCPVQLPGRSFRLNEVCSNKFYDLVQELLPIIKQYNDKDIILYGHSMGSVLAYEIAVQIKGKPALICLTGGDAPHEWKGRDFHSNFSDEEMLDWMIRNYGYSSVDHAGMKDYLLPFVHTLRNDLQICENYETRGMIYEGKTIIFGAKDDHLCTSDLNQWKQYCPNSEVIYFEEGGHFFNKVYANELVSAITKKIEQATHK